MFCPLLSCPTPPSVLVRFCLIVSPLVLLVLARQALSVRFLSRPRIITISVDSFSVFFFVMSLAVPL